MVTLSPGPTPASFPEATPNMDLLSVMLALTLCLPPNPPSFFRSCLPITGAGVPCDHQEGRRCTGP